MRLGLVEFFSDLNVRTYRPVLFLPFPIIIVQIKTVTTSFWVLKRSVETVVMAFLALIMRSVLSPVPLVCLLKSSFERH